ncbi:Glycosyltransferase involved in cell wall bisynthesis [Brevibacterium jeotgali]|uniref:Glycosyltransferase involved in cell wall bisynthesis n=1 Tax=Brevibacterium jeotgali TaxID=1262550 RepID=A0A2H1L7H8_9MICO|nr:glycosyltransferase involved in cell wall biosynthesis [Brevibacterium jeotgali]SMY12837.1 Glycosyltransferase involved in cell wall bisynthesis [Brevibacterium jeotgali]
MFDARYTRWPRHDGISRYGAGILGGLTRLAAVDPTVSVEALVSDPRQVEMLPPVPTHRVSAPTSPAEPLLARQVNKLDPDIVFSPMQTMGSWGRDYQLILTLHDLIYYAYPTPPRDLPLPIRGLWRAFHTSYWPQRLLLDRADAVATVSQTTRDLMVEHSLTRRPPTVVPNAADPVDPLPARASGHDARTLVYMGAFLPYKNAEALVRSLAWLPGYTLHLASRISPRREAELRALVPDGARAVFHRGISDEEYASLLDRATALVTASRAEGYGLPVVEALSRGVPVVLTDMPIFREIAGGTETAGSPARFADPDDPQDFARAVRSLEDPAQWSRASAAAPQRAAAHSWDSSARTLLELARSLME